MEKKSSKLLVVEWIKAKLEPIDVDQAYCDMLNDAYSLQSVGGPFRFMLPSEVLKNVDPTTYRCGLVDWIEAEMRDGNLSKEIDGEHYDQKEVEAIQEGMEGELGESADRRK